METAKEWFDTMITGSPDIKEVISEIQREAYNQALEDAIALRKRIGNPYNEREGKAMLNFEIEARKLKK